MATVEQNLQAIKNAVYGKDVRVAIHDSIEAINNKVNLDSESVRINTAYKAINDNSYAIPLELDGKYIDITDGTIKNDSSWAVSEYISLDDISSNGWITYLVTTNDTSTKYCGVYDADQQYVGSLAFNHGNLKILTDRLESLINFIDNKNIQDVAYLRLSFEKSKWNNIRLYSVKEVLDMIGKVLNTNMSNAKQIGIIKEITYIDKNLQHISTYAQLKIDEDVKKKHTYRFITTIIPLTNKEDSDLYLKADFWYNKTNVHININSINEIYSKTANSLLFDITIPEDYAYPTIDVWTYRKITNNGDYEDHLNENFIYVLTMEDITNNIFNDVKIVKSNNLMASSNIEISDYLHDGTWVDNNSGRLYPFNTYCSFAYIPCYGRRHILIDATRMVNEEEYTQFIYNTFYDKDYKFIKGFSFYAEEQNYIDIPENAYYISISFPKKYQSLISIDTYLENEDRNIFINQKYLDRTALRRNYVYSGNVGYSNYQSNKVAGFLFFADSHGQMLVLNKIVSYAKQYSQSIDDVICGGDIVGTRYSDGIDYWHNVPGSEKILLIPGNHDHYGSPSIDAVYEMELAPFIENWDGVIHSGTNTYWYKDYTDSKLRVIGVDVMNWEGTTQYPPNVMEAQRQWFISVLNDAKSKGYSVLGVQHYNVTQDGYEKMDCNFSPYNAVNTGVAQAAFTNEVRNFINNGGEFVGWLTGHLHIDCFFKDTKSSQKFYSVASAIRDEAWGDQARTDVAFNLVFVDTSAKVIKFIRPNSQNIDVFLRPRNAITINYLTGEIISQW